jgi:tetratricopeptide (TPR) repeat protein
MANYIKDDPRRLYEGYNEIIEANGSDTKAQVFLFDMNAAIDLYKNGVLSAEDVLNTYQKNMSFLENAPAKTDFEAEQNAKIKKDLESLFISSHVASCDDLIALFTPRYEANPEDLGLVTNIVKMMSVTEDCTDNDLYLNAVTSWYKLEPSHTSAYFLYKLNSSRGNSKEAIKYLEEAIAFETSDEALDAEYMNELAAYCYKSGQSVKAYETARKVIEMNSPFTGKAYMLMGTIWGATNCGGDEVSRRAPYWAAVDCLQKAKAADETLTEEANRLIATYSRYFPQTADAFMYGFLDGQSYTVSCGGLRAVTTVRTQK